jgi:NifU-like protein involved in Fe-S cluster formation
MSDDDLMRLYSQRILALTTAIPHLGRLPAPQGEGRKRAPLCGSVVTAQVVLRDGRVAEYAQEVRACALGQASAAVLGGAVLGRNLHELERGRDQLAAMLRDGAPVPEAPFDGLQALQPARDFPNRHASILLAFEAAIAAVQAAGA